MALRIVGSQIELLTAAYYYKAGSTGLLWKGIMLGISLL